MQLKKLIIVTGSHVMKQSFKIKSNLRAQKNNFLPIQKKCIVSCLWRALAFLRRGL